MATLLKRTLFFILFVAGMLLATFTRQGVPSFVGALGAHTAPLFGIGYRSGQNLRAALAAIADRRNLRVEQSNLKKAFDGLQQQNQQLEAENRSLKASLKVQSIKGLGVVTVAPVIDDDPSSYYAKLYLGAGSNQGLTPGMAVTTPAGLVGVITLVNRSTSVVRTLLDPESQVGVRLASKAGRGRALGEPPEYLRVELAPEAKVQIGDKIVSNSTQGLFPAGLTVGTVERIDPVVPGKLKRLVYVRPAVQFSVLEEVQVLRTL